MLPPNDPPPPYAGLSPFSLTSYNDAVDVDNWVDSLRLPSYQPRTNRRYHPYLRTQPTLEDPLMRYQNTIYDETYMPLFMWSEDVHVPILPTRVVTTLTFPPPPTIPAPLPPASAPLPQPATGLTSEEPHRRRVHILQTIPDIENTIQVGLKAAEKLASQSPATEECQNRPPPHDEDDNAPAAT